MPYVVNASLCIVNYSCFLRIVRSRNSRFVLLSLSALSLEIPYPVCSCPSSNALLHCVLPQMLYWNSIIQRMLLIYEEGHWEKDTTMRSYPKRGIAILSALLRIAALSGAWLLQLVQMVTDSYIYYIYHNILYIYLLYILLYGYIYYVLRCWLFLQLLVLRKFA